MSGSVSCSLMLPTCFVFVSCVLVVTKKEGTRFDGGKRNWDGILCVNYLCELMEVNASYATIEDCKL